MAIRKPTKAAGATGKKKPARDPTEPSDSEMIARECLLSPSFQGAAAIQAWEGFAGKTNFSDLVKELREQTHRVSHRGGYPESLEPSKP